MDFFFLIFFSFEGFIITTGNEKIGTEISFKKILCMVEKKINMHYVTDMLLLCEFDGLFPHFFPPQIFNSTKN